MITLLEQPADFVFSKNPIKYKASTNTDLNTEGLYIRCRIFFNGVFRIAFPLVPDATGVIEIDIRRVIDSLLLFETPSQSLAVEDLVNQYANCHVELHEITTAIPEDPDYVTTNTSQVVKGGLAYEVWDRNNYFSLYDNEQKAFLTWYPIGRRVTTWQKHWLTYLHLNDNAADVSVVAKVYFTDGTDQEASLFDFPDGSAAVKGRIYRFPVGYEQTGIDAVNSLKTVFKYDIQVKAGEEVICSYNFKVDYKYDYEKIALHYFGSLGGFESLRLLGETEPEDIRDYDAAEKFTDGFNSSREVYSRTNIAKLSIGEQFKSNIGWTDELNVQDLRREIFYSRQVQRLVDSRWWPVDVSNKSIPRGALSAQVRQMEIVWAYAFTNENYSPSFASISRLTCALSIVGISISAAEGVTYSATWTNVGGTPSSVQLLVSTDGGVTFNEVEGAVQVDETHYTYSLGSEETQDHIVRLVPYCSPGNPGISAQKVYTAPECDLTISDIEIIAGTPVDFYSYDVTWTNSDLPDSVQLEVSTDGGTTWVAAAHSTQTSPTSFTYDLGLTYDITHMIRLSPMCSPTATGEEETATHTADPEECTRFVPNSAITYIIYDSGFDHFIFKMLDTIAGPYHCVGVEITKPDTSVVEYIAAYGVDGGGYPADEFYYFSVGMYSAPGLYKFRFRVACVDPPGIDFDAINWGPYNSEFLEVTI